MENLTLAQRIIKPHTVDPLDGHTVVVIEKVGEAGEEFRFEIEPGMRVPKTRIDLFKWLRGGRSGPSYFAYAVNGDPQLRLEFTAPVKMEDQIHSFLLVVTAKYRASAPRLLVARRNDDPIRKLRKEIAGVLHRELASRSWIRIRNEFREIAQEAIDATGDSLRRFAATYGLTVEEVSLSRELSELDLVVVRKEAETERDMEVQKLQASLDRQIIREESATRVVKNERGHEEVILEKRRENELLTLQDLQTLDRERLHAVGARARLDRIADAATDAAITGFGNIGGSIRTPAELMQTVAALQSTVDRSRAFIEASVDSGEATDVPGTPPRLTDGQNGAGSAIAEMLMHTSRMSCSIAQKQRLQSAILHLIAELLLDDEAASACVDEYRERIAAIRSEAQLSYEQFEYLKKFVDTTRLRDELR